MLILNSTRHSSGKLEQKEDLLQALSTLPMVSIDLIVHDIDNRILLGKRKNPPAKGYYFVPGGRIRRMESLLDAFRRITLMELGLSYELEDSVFLGIFEHMYGNSAFSEVVGSHYVSIGMRINLDSSNTVFPAVQHSKYRWLSIEEICVDADVHPCTKEFFNKSFGIR